MKFRGFYVKYVQLITGSLFKKKYAGIALKTARYVLIIICVKNAFLSSKLTLRVKSVKKTCFMIT